MSTFNANPHEILINKTSLATFPRMEKLSDNAILNPLAPKLALNRKEESITLVDEIKPDLKSQCFKPKTAKFELSNVTIIESRDGSMTLFRINYK